MAKCKREEECVWMAEYMGKWPSKRGPISKNGPSDGCGGGAVLLALGLWYDFHEVGCHLGNVGLDAMADSCPSCNQRGGIALAIVPAGDGSSARLRNRSVSSSFS